MNVPQYVYGCAEPAASPFAHCAGTLIPAISAYSL